MILIACVDGRNGMAFNRRRQSRDRAVRADLLAEIGERPLWVNAATARQFAPEEQPRLRRGRGSPALWRTAPWRPLPGGRSR